MSLVTKSAPRACGDDPVANLRLKLCGGVLPAHAGMIRA